MASTTAAGFTEKTPQLELAKLPASTTADASTKEKNTNTPVKKPKARKRANAIRSDTEGYVSFKRFSMVQQQLNDKQVKDLWTKQLEEMEAKHTLIAEAQEEAWLAVEEIFRNS